MSKLNFNDLLDKEDVDEIFTLEEEIASGSFGTVYRGTHVPSKQTMAIKIITPEDDEIPEDLMIEIALLKQCRFKNIVRYYGGYRKGDEIFIAMELCSTSVRDIFDYSEDPLLEKEIALIARQSLEGLEYMHQNNFIHRDIKGGNILITEEGEVKLVDFGVSSLDGKKAKTFVGTPYWMAPELIESKSGLTGYGPEIDIWALGITCIELAESMPPLSYINPMRALFQIPARDAPTLEKKAKWSAEFHDFLAKCLEKNPKKRPNATELLKHPFVRDCDQNPQILKDLVKRKQKFEQGGEDWDEEDEEIDFEEDEFIEDEELSKRINSESTGSNEPKSTPKKEDDRISLVQINSSASNSSSSLLNDDEDDLESWLQGSKGSANQQLQVPILQTSQSTPAFNIPAPSSPAPSHPSIANTNSPMLKTQSESVIQTSSPNISELRNSISGPKSSSSAKGRSTMKRPPPTHRPGAKKSNYIEKARPLNKRLIKEQMAALRAVQAKEQRRVEKQERDQAKEREVLLLQYKKQLETAQKNAESNKLKMDKQHKLDSDSLSRAQKDNRKGLTKQIQTEQKNKQLDIKELSKLALKNHTEAQKKRGKEQKDILKQSKKIRTKSELKLMEKEHKVELLLNDLIFNLGQARAKLAQEHELNWNHNAIQQKTLVTDLQQTQTHELEMLKQIIQTEIEYHVSNYRTREEEMSKLQPLNLKQVQERHQMQQQNLQNQLDVERQQQTDLLMADQKNQKKDYLEKKKKLEKENLLEQKQLTKLKGRPKSEVKLLQQESRSKFVISLQGQDKEFEELLVQQRKEEEEQITLHHNRQKEAQFERHLAELEEIERNHVKQQLEFRQEELNERTRIVTEHHTKLKELQTRHHSEQTTTLQTAHEGRLSCITQQHKESNELVDNNKKEVVAFVQQNLDKLLPASQGAFKERVDDHFKEAVEANAADQKAQQLQLNEELEKQSRDLQQSQFQELQDLDKLIEKEKNDLATELSNLIKSST